MHRAGEERVLEDKLPLDPGFATVLLDWKRASEGADSGLVLPSYITGQCYHASPLQQDWIRRAGWCLVPCPECAAAPGTRCAGFSMRNRKRLRIGVHKARAARPPRRSTWAASDGTPPPQVRDPVAGGQDSSRRPAAAYAACGHPHHGSIRGGADGQSACGQQPSYPYDSGKEIGEICVLRPERAP